MKRALVITVEGKVEKLDLADDAREELEALQGAVGGYIQTVPIRHGGITCFCNEEGKLIGLPRNELATRFAGWFLAPDDYIAGDLVVMGGVDAHGETRGLTPEQETWVLGLPLRSV
jgi:hypothetical protein